MNDETMSADHDDESEVEREYTVYLSGTAGLMLKVTATSVEGAIDEAYNQDPGGICAQCSGWGGEKMSRDWPEQMELDSVEVDGETVLQERSIVDHYREENDRLRAKVERMEKELMPLLQAKPTGDL